MNRVILLGRLARNPELRYTQTAEPIAVCKFTVAVKRPYARDGEITAEFINCTAFGKRAENINQYFCKGSRIGIQGRLQVSNYTDQRGNKKCYTDVLVEDFEFVDTKADNEARGGEVPHSTSQTSQTSYQGFSVDEDNDEDLPF